jgi:hypothetical protein
VRIVSLLPSTTEIPFARGAGGGAVGATLDTASTAAARSRAGDASL